MERTTLRELQPRRHQFSSGTAIGGRRTGSPGSARQAALSAFRATDFFATAFSKNLAVRCADRCPWSLSDLPGLPPQKCDAEVCKSAEPSRHQPPPFAGDPQWLVSCSSSPVPLCKPFSQSRVINYSFQHGLFPDELKIGKILAIFKQGDKLDPNNYRPISILPVISKIFERGSV